MQWGYDRESPEVGRLFANSDAGKRLRRLRVSTSDTGSPFPWAEVLANAPLEELEVTAGSGTNAPELLEALARTAASGRLRTLRIFGINTPAVGVAGWLKTGYAAGVRELALESTHLSDSALRGLAESPELARLTRLTVNGYGTTTPEGLQALFESPHLTGLRHLDASTAGLTAANVLRLAERGSCRGLRVVNLGQLTEYRGGVPVKSAGEPAALSLGRGKPFPHLHTVKTWGVDEELNPEAFRELLESPNLFNLVALRLGVRDSKLADWRKFAAGTGLAWIGGGVSNGNWVTGSVALHPENVYLPNHLDDFGH